MAYRVAVKISVIKEDKAVNAEETTFEESLRKKQSRFAQLVGLLIIIAYSEGYEITLGDAWARNGHKAGSKHYLRLAIDLNLFRDGKYLTETKDHQNLGEFWEALGGIWGGRFGDGNHYEL